MRTVNLNLGQVIHSTTCYVEGNNRCMGENEMPRVSYWVCIDYTPLRWGPVRGGYGGGEG